MLKQDPTLQRVSRMKAVEQREKYIQRQSMRRAATARLLLEGATELLQGAVQHVAHSGVVGQHEAAHPLPGRHMGAGTCCYHLLPDHNEQSKRSGTVKCR